MSNLTPQKQPFFYLTFFFVAGILADRFLGPLLELRRWPLMVSGILVVGLAIGWICQRRHGCATLALFLSFAIAGALLSQTERGSIAPDRLRRLLETGRLTPDDPVELTGVLTTPPEPAPDIFYLDLEATSIRLGDELLEATGHVRLVVATREEIAAAEWQRLQLDYGSRLRLLVRLTHACSYKNPGSPDFDEFLERQGYDVKGTVKSPLLIETLGKSPVNPVLSAIYHFRLRALAGIDRRFREPVSGTLKALLLGNSYYLDGEVSRRLREGATFHTLVISGSHISLLAWFVIHVQIRRRPHRAARLRPTRQRPSAARILLALIILWGYAVMVGLAPPVSRAAVMISVGLFAPLLFRRAASINTVALAAFLMLAVKPALVADAGFQLSFLAVAGMVAVAMPLLGKLKQIGDWRPEAQTPHPPACSKYLRTAAELLYWNDRQFRREMQSAPITYRLEKSPSAITVNQLRIQLLVRNLTALLVTSAVIQVMTLPLMIYNFNRVAPVGILLNVIAGFLTAVIMLFAVLAICAGAVSASLAVPFIWLVNQSHTLLVNAVNPFVGIPLMSFQVPHYQDFGAILYAIFFLPIGVFVWLLDMWEPVSSFQFSVFRDQQSVIRKPRARLKTEKLKTENWKLKTVLCSLATAAILATLVAVLDPAPRLPRERLTVYFLDVGQGDAALIVFPHGTTMLVDGGGELTFAAGREPPGQGLGEPDEESATTGEEPSREPRFSVGEAVVSRFLWSQGLTHVDYVVATHADADHIGGLSAVLKNFSVNEAIVGRMPAGNVEFENFRHTLDERGVPMAVVNRGESFEIDGVQVDVLHPTPSVQGASKPSGKADHANNTSVVLRLVYGRTAILLSGDIEREAEAALLKAGFDLRAEVLKVPHHGSKTSSTAGFLDAVKPQYAVISVGERSPFGHPHGEVVARYAARGITILQTGRGGMVTAQTDGKTLSVWSSEE